MHPRMVENTNENPSAFDPAVKMAHLLQNPLHFPTAVLGTLPSNDFGEVWRQVIGVLGLFDTVLLPWVYTTVTMLLFGTFFVRLTVGSSPRWRAAAFAGATTLAYIFATYLVCYLAFTPLNSSVVLGVQGRYFTPVLALAAITVAAVINLSPKEFVTATIATSAAVLSGCASVEAILRTDWT